MFVFDAKLSTAIEAGKNGDNPSPRPAKGPLSPELLDKMQRYWYAANYLTVGQIYLHENPLLREPLRRSTSSRACSGTGALRPDRISSMFI